MDIYRFLRYDSKKDILRHRGPFNPLEMAFIIYESDNLLSEKHDAYRELLSDYPNMELEASAHNKKSKNLHQCLRAILVRDDYRVERFYAVEANVTYQAFVSAFMHGDMYGTRDWESEIFRTFAELWGAIGTYWERSEILIEDFAFTIKKSFMESGKYLLARLNYDGELLEISDHEFSWSDYENEPDDPAGFLNDYLWNGLYKELYISESSENHIVIVGKTRRWNRNRPKW